MTRTLILALTLFLAVEADAQGEYPLHTGNLWQYSVWPPGSYLTTRIMGDTILTNGKTYMILGGAFAGLIRQEGTRVFTWLDDVNDERVIYDFAGRTGDTVATHTDFGDTVDVIVLDYGMADVFGRTLNTWRFLEQSRHTSMYILRTVVDSIGMSASQAEVGDFFGLRGAIINGIQYGIVTGAPNPEMRTLPKFVLKQNYPNPFNPLTIVSFQLPTDVYVSLTVFDLLGREVKTLVEGYATTGTHMVSWDGTNTSGDRVGSGVYVYRLAAPSFTSTRRMVLLK